MAHKVHDQIKAVLTAWNKWTEECLCICPRCIMLDGAIISLINAFTHLEKGTTAKVKSNRPKRIVRSALSAWSVWKCKEHSCDANGCIECLDLSKELEKLNQFIEAGPEPKEEKDKHDADTIQKTE